MPRLEAIYHRLDRMDAEMKMGQMSMDLALEILVVESRVKVSSGQGFPPHCSLLFVAAVSNSSNCLVTSPSTSTASAIHSSTDFSASQPIRRRAVSALA